MVAIAAAAIGAGGAAYAANKNASASKKAAQIQAGSSNPEWVNTAAQDLYGRAQEFADKPYEGYTGDRVAGLSGNQQSAINNSAANVGRFDNQYKQIQDLYGQSANPYTQTYTPTDVKAQDWLSANVTGYMNPYLEASLNPQLKGINQDYALRQNANNAKAAGAGSFGGSRAGINEAMITGQQQDKLNDVRATGYNTAYNTAMQQFNDDANRGLDADKFNVGQDSDAFKTNYEVFSDNAKRSADAAKGLTGLVGMQRDVTSAVNNDLLKTGALQQGQGQALLDDLYGRYQEEKNYPREMTEYLSGILNNNPTLGRVQTAPAPRNNIAQNIGTGLQLAGAANSLYNQYQQSSNAGTTDQFANGAQGWVNPDSVSSLGSSGSGFGSGFSWT